MFRSIWEITRERIQSACLLRITEYKVKKNYNVHIWNLLHSGCKETSKKVVSIAFRKVNLVQKTYIVWWEQVAYSGIVDTWQNALKFISKVCCKTQVVIGRRYKCQNVFRKISVKQTEKYTAKKCLKKHELNT